MGDWIGIAFIVFLVLCALYGLSRLSKPYDISQEEFEKRAHEAPSLMSAGFSGLQKILDPAAGKAMETKEDLKQGRYDKKQVPGDKPEAGSADHHEAGHADHNKAGHADHNEAGHADHNKAGHADHNEADPDQNEIAFTSDNNLAPEQINDAGSKHNN